MTDHLTALRTYLLGQKDVTDLCGQKVYVMDLPRDEVGVINPDGTSSVVAHKVVVLLTAGGEMRGHAARSVIAPKVDVVCFGETWFEAAKMDRAVADALRALQRVMCDGVLLHNATLATGPMQTRDPVLPWPAMRRQATVRADERSE